MSHHSIMLVLRLVHILFGLFWAGTAIALAAFVIPAARAHGPAGGRFMQELMQHRRLSAWLGVAAALTVLSGAAMYWRIATDMHDAWIHTRPGLVLGFGGLVALVALALGAGVAAPTARNLEALGTRMRTATPVTERSTLAYAGPDALVPSPVELPPPAASPSAAIVAEMMRLQSRLALVSRAIAALLAIAAGCMAIARYL